MDNIGARIHNTREPWSSNYPVPSQVSSRQAHFSENNPEEVATLMCMFEISCVVHWSIIVPFRLLATDTAAVDDANDFTLENGYDLRPRTLSRHTELMVGITYYNEEKALLCRTLHSAIEACRKIQSLKKSDFWGKGGPTWQKLVICIIFDGLAAADPGALDSLAAMGLFQRGLMKTHANGESVSTHLVS